jgi:Chromate resistance exported protein
MKWITREKVKVDRVACPRLIKKFVDKDAEFVFVPGEKVMAEAKRLDAIPYDVKDVELGHHGKECSFEAILKKYKLTGDPAWCCLGGSSTAPTPITRFTINRRDRASKPSLKVFGISASRTTMSTMRLSGSSTTRSWRIAARWSSTGNRTATL